MSGTDDPTHIYWDLENRKGLWARGEAMSETPTARELLSHLRGGDFSPCDNPHHVEWLASRVEAVLVYCQFVREERSGVVVASKIERILDGGKP